MSEVRLIVREADRDWSGCIHGSSADRAIAALSADPVTLTELEAACARFATPTPNQTYLANLSPGLHDEPYDAGIVVIDLAARLVAVDSTYSSPCSSGEVCYHNGRCATDKWLPYHLADDWLLIGDAVQWPAIAGQRRRERSVRPPLDARRVFYGRPLLDFVARETFAAFAQRLANSDRPVEEPPDSFHGRTDEDITYDTLRQIHVDWLLTPRDDLEGVCPRDVALERRNHIEWDLQDQCQRWSLLQKCPPGLDSSSFAFRFGGFGTHELVQYYSLVRELLESCWDRLLELALLQSTAGGPAALTVGDFLTDEVPRLESVRDRWLDTPDPEFHGRTPRSIIDRERARLPEGMSGHDAMADPDCPCCQMLADMPGPMFWHLDGSSMDDDFAFDMHHRTRDEWEEEQRRWEEDARRFRTEAEERRRLAGSAPGCDVTADQAVWSSSFSGADAPDTPLAIRLFGIGGHLAELIDALRGDAAGPSAAPEVQQFIDWLNRDFGNLREILQTADPSLADALLQPVIDRFGESLAAVALAYPELTLKCESLTGSLTRFLERGAGQSAWDSDDSDIPF